MSIYCQQCGAENLDIANFCRACGAKLFVQSSEEHAPSKTVDERVQKGYDRIAGWLILLGLGVFFTPFSLIASFDATNNIDPIANFINWSMLLLSFSFWYFFFQRKKVFVKLFIGFLVFEIAVQILNAVADSSYAVFLLRSIIYAAIWIPYLLISERSKQTFVN